MLLTNAKARASHKYFNFYYDPEEKVHVCWYLPLNGSTIQEKHEIAKEILEEKVKE